MTSNAARRIKSLYYDTTKSSIEKDLQIAVDLFKTLEDDSSRDAVAVYMDGLSQMRSEWRLEKSRARDKMRRKAAKLQKAQRNNRKSQQSKK
jgi:uncharacterized coiled-coil protein SlyX